MLVTYERYTAITGDTATEEVTATGALVEAQDLLEEELGRVGYLEDTGDDVTERLRIFSDSRLGWVVYPSAVPITDEGDLTSHGAVLAGASPDSSPAFGFVSGEQWATITYRGGYTTSTVPRSIERDIAWNAYQLVHGTPAAVPVGAKAVSLGDASVTYDRPQVRSTSGIAWSSQTLRHRRRRV